MLKEHRAVMLARAHSKPPVTTAAAPTTTLQTNGCLLTMTTLPKTTLAQSPPSPVVQYDDDKVCQQWPQCPPPSLAMQYDSSGVCQSSIQYTSLEPPLERVQRPQYTCLGSDDGGKNAANDEEHHKYSLPRLVCRERTR